VGDYGIQAADELLMAKQSDTHPTAQADLFRKRFVVNQETDDGQRLNESLVKRMTGGDRIRARRMRDDRWEFAPTHTLFLATNHKPTVRGTDNAIWCRLRLDPFTVEIPEAQQDHKLADKLQDEAEGILAWLIRGHMDWLQNGLGEPEEVTQATAAYRGEQDVLAAFIDDMCVVRPDVRVGSQSSTMPTSSGVR
jgi:putative DNA primase/helicase